MKKYYGLIIMFVCVVGLNAQVNEQTLAKFKSADWPDVKAAKMELENSQKEVIPILIEMIESDEEVKITNTGNLIYPGAEKFFGHGQMLDYDIDYLSIRAGWLLEDLTFNNFGFSGIHLPKEMLINHIKLTYPEYYNNSSNRKKLEDMTDEQMRKVVHKLAIAKTKVWWKAEGSKWSRIKALELALQSFDEKRQVKALFYMRNGTSKCEGLDQDHYINVLVKEIARLNSSEVKRVAEHAKLILLDSKYEWLDIKQ